jgi:hypothetical protein
MREVNSKRRVHISYYPRVFRGWLWRKNHGVPEGMSLKMRLVL